MLQLKLRLIQILYYITTVVLIPLLVLQALWLRRTVLTLPEPQGKRSGVCGDGATLKLLIIGDSAAAGVGVNQQHDALAGQLALKLAVNYEVNWHLIANTGFTSGDIIKALNHFPAQHFDYVVVSVGINDVTHLTRAHHWTNNLTTITELLNCKFSTSKVILSSVPPIQLFSAIPRPLNWWLGIRAKKLNKLMAKVVKGKDHCAVLRLDLPFKAEFLAQDGIHPSVLAYQLWAKQVVEKIV